MACRDIFTFFRVCGHTYEGSRHSPLCLEVRTKEFACWNPLPRKIELKYLVEHCPNCLTIFLSAMEPADAGSFLNDPFTDLKARRESLGENAQVVNQDNQRGWEINELALIARAEQMHYDVTTRNQRELQQLEVTKQFVQRRLEWTRASDKFHYPPNFRPTPYVVYALDRNTTPNEFFVEAQRPLQYDTCTICQEELIPEVEAGSFEVPVNMARELECGHLFHHACIETWLVSSYNPCCPVCRSDYNIICAYGYEKPVWRFYPTENMYYQISGFVKFPSTGRGGKGFTHLGDEPDPWGDLLEE